MTDNPPTFTHLKRWERQPYYMGKTYDEYYVVYGVARDATLMGQSNFAAILEELGGESETVLVERTTHWLCGWIETIYVHESDHDRLVKADNLIKYLTETYPILDEDDYNDRLHEATLELLEDIKRFPEAYPDRPRDKRKLYEYAEQLVEI